MEREIKLRVPGAKETRRLLRGAGFVVAHRRVFEANLVLDSAGTELRQSGRLLRLRQAGGVVTVTFKGQSLKGRHKVRPEFEVTVSGFEEAAAIFAGLGFEPMFRYEKYRTEFRRPDAVGLAMLDETPIGTFLELEGAAHWIDATARELGFRPRDYVTASYGALYLDYCRERQVAPTNMVFR